MVSDWLEWSPVEWNGEECGAVCCGAYCGVGGSGVDKSYIVVECTSIMYNITSATSLSSKAMSCSGVWNCDHNGLDCLLLPIQSQQYQYE